MNVLSQLSPKVHQENIAFRVFTYSLGVLFALNHLRVDYKAVHFCASVRSDTVRGRAEFPVYGSLMANDRAGTQGRIGNFVACLTQLDVA